MSGGTEMNLTSSGSAIYVTLMQEFQRCPTQFFRMEQGGRVLRHDPSKINVCIRSAKTQQIFPDSMGGHHARYYVCYFVQLHFHATLREELGLQGKPEVLKVSSESQMQALMSRLLEKPIFLGVGVERNKKAFCSNIRYITKGLLAVTVNTQHPRIHSILQSQLVQGLDAMRQGKKFAVEFDFTEIFVAWIKSLYPDDSFDCDFASGYESTDAKFTVTNDEEFMDCYACTYPEVLAWILCLPCCLLTCPCYRIHRALTVSDFGGAVQDVVPTYWSANAELRNMEETVALVLTLLGQQEHAEEATMADRPPTYSAATGQHLYYDQPTVQVQPGYSSRTPQPYY